MPLACLVALVLAGLPGVGAARAESSHFDPDNDSSRIAWTAIDGLLGPAPDVRGQRFGIVVKTLTNEYWRQMSVGYRARAAADGVKLDIQGAQNESDQVRQLAILENMIGSRYGGLLVSPQSASNLQSAIDDAAAVGIPVVDVDGAVVDSVRHFVGPVNLRMGAAVGEWFVRTYPAGGEVAVIEGQSGVFSTVQRTSGFRGALAGRGFSIVASVSGQWDRKKAGDEAAAVLLAHPDLIGIYCNNDVMALGVVDAVKSLHRLDRVRVFGTDGTRAAYASIRAGELTGTVDIFPRLTGEIGLEIAERVAAGQAVPRVVETPQALVTRDNMDRYAAGDGDPRRAILDDAARGR